MTLQVIVHKAEEGGYWAEVPALPGCATQGESLEELMANVREAVNGWLDVKPEPPADAEVYEIAV
jgi:predicted RNase H-like HicB family nuclease